MVYVLLQVWVLFLPYPRVSCMQHVLEVRKDQPFFSLYDIMTETCFVLGAEHPHTLSEEWRQKTTEYLKSQNSNPISGISSEGYKGKGY